MLVVWGIRANSYLSVPRMPKMEKRVKEAQKRIRSTWYQLATSVRKKVAWQVIGKQMGSWAFTEISKRYGGWQQRGSNGKRAGMAEEQ